MIANRALIALLTAAALFLGGYFLGKADEREDQLAKKATALELVIEKHDQVAEVGRVEEKKTAQRAAKTEAIFNGITNGALIYVQANPAVDSCRLDALGLRLWTDANAGADAQSATGRYAGVPDPPAAAERSGDGSPDQPHRGGEGVSPVPGPAPGPDQLAGENS